jgi:hypothetical protein
MASEPSDYRAQVESLLAAAADEEAAANVVRGTPAANLGERFLALLRDADAELERGDVDELVALIDERLASWG